MMIRGPFCFGSFVGSALADGMIWRRNAPGSAEIPSAKADPTQSAFRPLRVGAAFARIGRMCAPELADLFADGTLIRPSDQNANLVHLIRALATLRGVPDLDSAPAVRELAGLIGPSQHLIFVLMDGMGMNLLPRLGADSFLATSLKREIRATCPSTTACALTTIATAGYPNQH